MGVGSPPNTNALLCKYLISFRIHNSPHMPSALTFYTYLPYILPFPVCILSINI